MLWIWLTFLKASFTSPGNNVLLLAWMAMLFASARTSMRNISAAYEEMYVRWGDNAHTATYSSSSNERTITGVSFKVRLAKGGDKCGGRRDRSAEGRRQGASLLCCSPTEIKSRVQTIGKVFSPVICGLPLEEPAEHHFATEKKYARAFGTFL